MAVSTDNTRIGGPYSCNGTQTAFPFDFKVFADTDVVVTVADSAGVETVKTITTDYTVALNADQDTNPGGTVNMVVAPADGSLAITSDIPATQSVVLTAAGNFSPTVVNTEFDKLTILIQQIKEILTRAVTTTVTSGTSPADLLASISTSVSNAAASAAQAAATFTQFTDQYLGAFAAAPTTDSSGNALTAGDLYWDTTAQELYIYTGSNWTPVGTLTATQLLTLLLTVDGSGSGLDADLLDGRDSTSFANNAGDSAVEFAVKKAAATDKAVPLGQLAPFDNSAAVGDVALNPGESCYITFTNAIYVPLNIACGDGELYEIELITDAASGSTLSNAVGIEPNNTTYPGAMTLKFLAGGASPLTGSQTVDLIGLVSLNQAITQATAKISTSTAYKYCISSSGSWLGTDYVAELSHAMWLDTTTAWTSLGTLYLEIATSGYILVKRIK